MAALVRLGVQDPQNIIDTYGTGAVLRLERDTVSTMATVSEVTTIAVVAGTTEYEYKDATGVAGTHWYRSRFSKATPADPTDYSGYGSVFQAGAASGEVITVETAKTWTGITDTADDGWVTIAVGACNRHVVGPRGLGMDLGPSPDTVRPYDASAAVQLGRRLWIRAGIRSFTKVEVSTDNATWTDVTTQMRVGPAAHERAPGEPGHYIEVIPGESLDLRGYRSVRITAPAFTGFGWEAWPMDIVQASLSAIQRLAADRGGRGSFPTETDIGRYFDPRTLKAYRAIYDPGLR
jgi:hypothetical protein